MKEKGIENKKAEIISFKTNNKKHREHKGLYRDLSIRHYAIKEITNDIILIIYSWKIKN